MKATLEQAKKMIINCRNTFYLKAEPGVGKTHLVNEIARFLDRPYIHLDVPQLNPEDISIPVPNMEKKILECLPSELLGLHLEKSPVICVDEISKAEQPIINALHTILHPDNKYVAGHILPKDTIVVCTGNLASDGLGDGMQGHSIDRVVPIEIRKPTGKGFSEWAAAEGKDDRHPNRDKVHPCAVAWVLRDQQVSESYVDLSEEDLKSNPYIYNPRIHNGTGISYVSYRGIASTADAIYGFEEGLHDEATMNLILCGILGEAGGMALSAMVQIADQIPTADEIKANPKGCKIPTDPAGMVMVCLSAPNWIEDRADAKAWLTYMKRIDRAEFHSLFMIRAGEDVDLKDMLPSLKEFREWSRDYTYLFDKTVTG